MKTLKENSTSLVFCLFELVVGILLLINPVGFTAGIIVVAGIVLMVLGVVEIVKYFRTSADDAVPGQGLTKGLLSCLVGGFCVFMTEWFIATFPVLTIMYGIIILVAGISKIQMSVDMIRRKNKKWLWSAISAVISIVCAIVIFKNPFTSTAVLWMFTGITLIVEAFFDIIAAVVRMNGE